VHRVGARLRSSGGANPRAQESGRDGIDPQGVEILLEIARDLTASLGARDRYARLLSAMRRLVPCDAACLLRLEGTELVPLAGFGLSEEALVRRYERSEHPRLDRILSAGGPLLFPLDSPLPDPFDGQLVADPRALEHIHSCLGCPLTEGGEVVGALTADALSPTAFDALDPKLLEALTALAGAAMRTSALIESLERLAARKEAVAREIQRTAGTPQILGRSQAAQRLRRDISVVAASDLPVLILGETGVGKELVAQQIHAESRRGEEALIHVNCAALPESIAESELFGHVAGAFTGATRDRAGKFEIADGATLFLDEVGELPLTLQPKLLRALQQGELQRVGDDRVHRVDVRVIAATNRDLEEEVRAGRFRADLYHRLAVYPLPVPPLRERRDDIPLLAAHFLDQSRRRLGLGPVRLLPEARERLVSANWPGNVRELENVLSRAALRRAAGTADRGLVLIRAEDLDFLEGSASDGMSLTGGMPQRHGSSLRKEDYLPHDRDVPQSGELVVGGGEEDGASLRTRTEEFQRRAIEKAVQENDGNWAAAARSLGMHRSNLHHLAKRLGLRD
jgi:anaerobic nitric oxide reductase transcription regulator